MKTASCFPFLDKPRSLPSLRGLSIFTASLAFPGDEADVEINGVKYAVSEYNKFIYDDISTVFVVHERPEIKMDTNWSERTWLESIGDTWAASMTMEPSISAPPTPHQLVRTDIEKARRDGVTTDQMREMLSMMDVRKVMEE